jgi:hypothetical protein
MLNQVPTIAAPHPPHILQRIFPLLPIYGNLENADKFNLLVDDVCRLIELNPVSWEDVTLDRQEVISRCRENSLIAVFTAVYDIYAEVLHKPMWCCKSLANIYYLREISNYLPYAKYIWIYRDGRDVACSFVKAVVGEKHFYHLAKQWQEAQSLALKMRRQLQEDQFFSLRYESLISNPEATLKSLCDFLNVDYTEKMLDFHQSKEALITSASSSLWEKVTQPVMKDNSRKFLDYSNPEEVRIFELIAGDTLSALGYKRFYTQEGETANFSPEEIAEFDNINQKRNEKIYLEIDEKDRERREEQTALLKNIKLRNLGQNRTLAKV